MDIAFKTIASAMVTAVFCLVLNKRDKDFSALLTILACAMILSVTLSHLKPVIDLVQRLQAISNVNNEVLGILLKSAGISLLCEIVCLICADVGNSALGKSVQILSSAVILWMSIPLFSKLLDMIGEILSRT